MSKYAVFGGRSRRKEYWFFLLFSMIISATLTIIDIVVGTFSSSLGIGLLSGIYSLAVLIPSIAVSVRRLHDIDRTGWWILISLVPIIGTIVLVVFAVQDGTPGSNQHGSNPKAAASAA
jgi:uncharacterized membrane protein YhaH (DUF805 family)